MKPLGIRFENFACFDECYVRLDQPLQILVGKNNAGKTAVLRGLTALRGLPIGDTNPIPFVLGGYARGSRGSGNFDFHIECSFVDGDFRLLGGALEQWPKVKTSGKRMFDFHFRVLANGNIVGLEAITLKLGDVELPLIRSYASQVEQLYYNQNGSQTDGQQLPKIADRSTDGGSWPVLASAGILSALAPLKNIRMIEAHRVARPEHNTQAMDELLM
jgi:hypothetical protein